MFKYFICVVGQGLRESMPTFGSLFSNGPKIQQATIEFLRSPAAKQIEDAAVAAGMTRGAAQAAAMAAARSHAMAEVSSPSAAAPNPSATTPLASATVTAAGSPNATGADSMPITQFKRSEKRGMSGLFKRSRTVAQITSEKADKTTPKSTDVDKSVGYKPRTLFFVIQFKNV